MSTQAYNEVKSFKLNNPLIIQKPITLIKAHTYRQISI